MEALKNLAGYFLLAVWTLQFIVFVIEVEKLNAPKPGELLPINRRSLDRMILRQL